MSDPAAIYDQLCAHARETALWESITSVLEWDERTYQPPAAAGYRVEQLTLLAGLAHRRRTDPRLGEWLAALAHSPLAADPHSDTGTTIRQLQRDYDKQTRLPQELVEELARLRTVGQHAWVEARQADNFRDFAPLLAQIVDRKREEADCLGHHGVRYDALLDHYEPGATTAATAGVLADLRDRLAPLVAEVAASGRGPDVSLLTRRYPVAAQEALARQAAEQIGFSFAAGRLDVTHHPFCSMLGPHDCRITTRYEENFFPCAFFGVLHEAGHGLYDQGLRAELYGLPPGSFASLGIHESQSRMWENLVGRSRAFWRRFYPAAQTAFPAALGDVAEEDFYFAINDVRPSLIRVEADEATYNLHIIVRFELEQALLAGDLSVPDLPGAWREKYRQLLGIASPTDADGVLQDVHWSAGLFGYFPTYALGNLYAAQFFEQAEREIGPLAEQFARGEFAPLRRWLNEKIHQPGQCYSAAEFVQRVTSRPLESAPLLRVLRAKLAPLYGLQAA